MGKYKKCPRCELNWINEKEELCEVCKAELGKASTISLLEDDEDEFILEDRICPVCKVNYLEADEDICATCRAEQAQKNIDKESEEGDDWQDYVDDEPIAEEDGEVSLSQLQEEEEEDFEEEEAQSDDFEEIGNIDDIEDIDEEEEEEEDL